MNAIENLYLAYAYNNIDILFVIILRLAGFVMMVPLLSGNNVPSIIKTAFVVVFSLLIFSTGIVSNVSISDNLVGNIVLFAKEFITGWIIGFVPYVIFSSINIMGLLMDFQLGLSMASVYDQSTGHQVPILGNFVYNIILLFFIQAGGLNSFLSIIFNSYRIIQPGQANLIFQKPMIDFIIMLVNESFILAIRFAMPIVGSILIVDVALGILVKAVPQVNVFVVGVPLKILLGLIMLLFVNPIFLNMFNHIFDDSYIKMIDIIQGLSLK